MAATEWGLGSNCGLSGYGDAEFWEQKYSEEATTSDWLLGWEAVADVFCRHVAQGEPCRILHPGCGNSVMAESMYDAGFRDVLSTDCSEAVIEQMAKRATGQQGSRPGLRWAVMDATAMDFPDESFDVVVEKGLLDALLCGESRVPAALYAKEVFRVLRAGGVLFLVSFSCRRSFLELGPWGFEILEACEVSWHGKPYHVCVCRKARATAALLAEWPCTLGMLSRGVAPEDARATEGAAGELLAVDRVEAGDVVEVSAAFTSGDSPSRAVLLEEGLRGIVRLVDADGDAVVLFPRLGGVDRAERFIMSEQVQHLRVVQSEQNR